MLATKFFSISVRPGPIKLGIHVTKGGTDKKTIKYFSQLDKDLLHKLYNVYKVDFDFFGYSMDEFSRI